MCNWVRDAAELLAPGRRRDQEERPHLGAPRGSSVVDTDRICFSDFSSTVARGFVRISSCRRHKRLCRMTRDGAARLGREAR
jgi:hypothetical protein